MKALSLLLLRVTTGLLLVIWGLIKIGAPDAAIGVSDKYYGGLLSEAGIQMGLGIAEALLGLLVVLGLFSRDHLSAAICCSAHRGGGDLELHH